MGRTIFENLLAGSPDRRVYPVNPNRAAVLGRKTSRNMGAVPEPVDLAVIATPAATVPRIVVECVAAGVCGAVIISAGFKDTLASIPYYLQNATSLSLRDQLVDLTP